MSEVLVDLTHGRAVGGSLRDCKALSQRVEVVSDSIFVALADILRG